MPFQCLFGRLNPAFSYVTLALGKRQETQIAGQRLPTQLLDFFRQAGQFRACVPQYIMYTTGR